MSENRVPFLDLALHHRAIQQELSSAMETVVQACAFAGGPQTAAFEADFADYLNVRYAIGVGSGTEALWLSLLALGVGPGHEVITVPNTFIATAEAISYCGATPVFVDIDPVTHTMDPAMIEAAITARTKAIVPVHLYGQPADMDPILAIANNHELLIVEDACQAHGAQYKGRFAGTVGQTGCFSFYPGKNLGAFGDAGAVVTDDERICKTIRTLRDHGQQEKYYHQAIGWNARMDGLQGAVLKVKLPHLDKWNGKRRKIATMYARLLCDIDAIRLPVEAPYAQHVWHLFPIQADRRDRLMGALAHKDIHCGIHYPVPIHLQPAYGFLGLEKGRFPVAEAVSERLVSLPMFPEMTDQQVRRVAAAIGEFYHGHGA